MPDGVHQSLILVILVPKHNDEKFSVLYEYKPYRKDDNFFYFDQPNIFNLARRGFIIAKVGICGTGSSQDVPIECEYTTQELDDCEHVIKQLADYSLSDGLVRMYADFSPHSCDNLYKYDIHDSYGILHLDHYFVSTDQTNALSTTPNYLMNKQWIKQRFTIRFWCDVYVGHQSDDDSFWRKYSIKYACNNLALSTYPISKLYDP
ncbi:unnamed protein product [Rotaria sp. Silwood1]|nr:unnamed protein product [Rotaria sp. Silwood1]CAF5020345.1 unnamed protein product [Rotaria sp. Silwood1]